MEGVGRFRKDVRLTGGSDRSLQINLNKSEGDRKDFTELNRGLELVGGDISRSKLNFFGDNFDIVYGPEKNEDDNEDNTYIVDHLNETIHYSKIERPSSVQINCPPDDDREAQQNI
mgnify:CR=1 FL=1